MGSGGKSFKWSLIVPNQIPMQDAEMQKTGQVSELERPVGLIESSPLMNV